MANPPIRYCLFDLKVPIDIEKCPVETLIFEDKSGLKTIRPTSHKKTFDADMNSTESEDDDETPQGPCMSKDIVIELSDDEEFYVMPSLLKKAQKVAAPPPEDTEVEDSDIKQTEGKDQESKHGS